MHVRLASDTISFRKSTLWMEYELFSLSTFDLLLNTTVNQ